MVGRKVQERSAGVSVERRVCDRGTMVSYQVTDVRSVDNVEVRLQDRSVYRLDSRKHGHEKATLKTIVVGQMILVTTF